MMKKSVGILGVVFLGAGLVLAASAWADKNVHAQPQLTEADQNLVTTFRKYSACMNEKRRGLVNPEGELDPQKIPPDLLKELLDKIRATVADLKSKDEDMPEVVINLIAGLQAADIVKRWAEQICKQEVDQDWTIIESRLKELSDKRDTPYGQQFFKALNAPQP